MSNRPQMTQHFHFSYASVVTRAPCIIDIKQQTSCHVAERYTCVTLSD